MRSRQAVVVIHGMGEQRPLGTLRSFISASVPPPSDPARPLYWSKPDAFGNEFELRRFTVPGSRDRPVSDVFEYYWADKMSGTKLRQLLPLAKALLGRLPWRVPSSLIVFYVMGWALVITLLVLAVRLANSLGPVALLDGVDVLKKTADGHSTLAGWGILVILMLTGSASTFAVNNFGDVARYLDAAPGNVGVRHAIKSDGLEMLRRIQDSGQFDRVVVVGHSLGSIIAMDLIGYLWGEEYSRHSNVDRPDQSALQEVQRLGPALAAMPSPSVEQVEKFQHAQRELWREQRRLGSPWLITDLVSVGSPLTHAALLLAPNSDSLHERQERFEIPVVPPIADDEIYSHRSAVYEAGDEKRKNTIRVLNSSAMFACTRWTNVWFPCRFGLFGDPFGGPLRPLFGNGVLDRPITGGPKWRFIPVLPHVWYWRGTSGTESQGNIALIRAALDLDSSEWLRDAPARPVSPSTDG